MNLYFTEEQEILRKSAKDFLASKFPKKIVKEQEESSHGYSAEMWKEMSNLGWMGLFIPENYGGVGMAYLDQAMLMEEMGRACMPGPYFSTMFLGAYPIMDFGTDAQKGKYLAEIANGNAIVTMALTEASGRTAADAVETKADASGDNWVINGIKLFVPDAHVANYIICIARTKDSGDPEKGLTAFIIDRGSAGVSIIPLKAMSDKVCEVSLKDVKVARDSVLGKVNEGWAVVQKMLDRAITAKCCELLGMSQQVLDMTVQYAKDRKQFDRAIGSFQIIQHYCADMFTEVEGMRLSTYQAAWKVNEGMPAGEAIAVARAWAMDAVEKILSLSHQIHGAMGSAIEYDLHYYTRKMKTAEVMLRSAEMYAAVLAGAVL